MCKKLTALLLCLLMCIGAFAACGTQSGGDPSSGSPESSSKAESPASSGVESSSTGSNAEHPNWITDTPVTLKIWTAKESNIEDFNTNEYIKWLQEETNVILEFDQSSTVETAQKLNLSLSSGDYPDIYWTAGSGISSSNLSKFGSSGVFIPMNDLIEQYGVNIKDWFSRVSYLEAASTSPDGNIYGIPNYSEIYHSRFAQKMWINQAWLDNLDLEMPTTLEEFRDVLLAFKNQDANGNGDPNDEIPLASCIDTWHGDPIDFLMCSFIYDDGDKLLTVTDDKVDSIINKEAYRDGLKYIAGMYADGLIYPETFTATGEQVKNLTAQDIAGCVTTGNPLGLMDISTNFFQNSTTVPPLKGPEGVQTCGYYGYIIANDARFIITSACENPEVAFKLADFMYSEEASMRLRQGVLDVDWKMAEPGDKTCDGRDAKYARITPLLIDGKAQNQHLANSGLFAESNDQYMGLWTTPEDFNKYDANYFEQLLYLESQKYEGYQPDQTLPPVVFTDEENAEVADIEVEIKKYWQEQRTLFVTGEKDIDTEWDNYVAQLEKLGLPTMIEMYDAAYNRQYVK